jgi:hypothetical protein
MDTSGLKKRPQRRGNAEARWEGVCPGLQTRLHNSKIRKLFAL